MSDNNNNSLSTSLLYSVVGIFIAGGLLIAIFLTIFAGGAEKANTNVNVDIPTVEAHTDYAPTSSAYNLATEYDQLSEDNIFRVATAEEVFKFIEHGTGILMLGYPECPWCQRYLPMLEEIAKREGVDKIVYYDTRKSRLEDPESYAKLLDLLGGEDGYPEYNNEGDLRIFVPFTAFIDHGKIIFADNETSDLDADKISPDEYWDDEHLDAFTYKMEIVMPEIALAMERCKDCSE